MYDATTCQGDYALAYDSSRGYFRYVSEEFFALGMFRRGIVIRLASFLCRFYIVGLDFVLRLFQGVYCDSIFALLVVMSMNLRLRRVSSSFRFIFFSS